MTTLEFNIQLTNLEDSLRRYASILASNVEDANDLLQDTYLRALDNKERFMASDYKNMKGWTYTIMKNIFINNYRKMKKRKNKIEDVSSEDSTLFDNVSDDNILKTIQLKEMNMAIDNLDKNQKVPLLMHLTGFKYNEIANELGINIGTVKSRIFFAKKNLRYKI